MAVVLEIVDGAASKHDVCQDVTTKAVEHGTEPGGHGAPARNLHRACNTGEEVSETNAHRQQEKLESIFTTHIFFLRPECIRLILSYSIDLSTKTTLIHLR